MTRLLAAAALLLAGCPDAKTPAPDPAPPTSAASAAAPPTKELDMPADQPFEILLSDKGVAQLRNGSSAAQLVLHSTNIQPAELVVWGPDGTQLDVFDERSRKKFDNTVTRDMFVELAPGATMPLLQLEIEKAGSSYDLTFGPFEFSGVPKGTYKAQAQWTSAANNAYDEATDQTNPVDGVWLGTVQSAKVDLQIR